MSDQRLRDLLHEQVLDLEPTDLAATAWTCARRTRQRRAAVVASAAVAAVVMVGVLVIGPGGGDDPVRPAQTPTATTTIPAGVVERGGDYRGATTWWAPPAAAEGSLPESSDLPIPPEIDLARGVPAFPAGIPAHAVYELSGDGPEPGRVVIVGHDGGSYSLDVGRLEPLTDELGNAMQPLGEESLAPDGRHVFFRQRESLEVYDLMKGTWASYPTVPWLAETARWLSDTEVWTPGELGSPDGPGTTYDVTGAAEPTSVPRSPRVWDTADEPYGPTRLAGDERVAQAVFLADPVQDPAGVPMGGLDAVAARIGDDVHLLVMSGPGAERWKGCCAVVGWLDDETVLMRSGSNASRILAWRVGTPDLWRVSRLIGWEPGEEVPVGSFADLRRG